MHLMELHIHDNYLSMKEYVLKVGALLMVTLKCFNKQLVNTVRVSVIFCSVFLLIFMPFGEVLNNIFKKIISRRLIQIFVLFFRWIRNGMLLTPDVIHYLKASRKKMIRGSCRSFKQAFFPSTKFLFFLIWAGIQAQICQVQTETCSGLTR